MSMVPADAPRRTPSPPRKLTLAEMQLSLASANASDKRSAVGFGQADPTTSVNPHPSRVYGDEEIDALVSDLVAARAGRGHRKAMRRPSRRRGQNDLFDVVRFHLRRLCRRMLNDRGRDGQEAPAFDLLVLGLERYLEQQCWHLVYQHDYGEQREPQRIRRTYLDQSRSGLTAVESVARSSARYALDNWSPDFIHEMQRLGRIGGKISKRVPQWTDADLDRLAALEGMTVAQQAAHLDVSMSSIDRMRRALRQR